MLMVTTRDEDRFKDQWYLDSGCSSHMSGSEILAVDTQCHNCQRYGHYSSDYSEKRKNQETDAKLAKHEEEEEMMLMVTTKDGDRFKDQWYMDSGC